MLTVSLVVLFGAVLALLLRSRQVGAVAALVAVLAGFYLAGTSAAPAVRHGVSSVIAYLNHLAH